MVGTGEHLARGRALVKSGGIYSTDVTGVVMDSSEELVLFAVACLFCGHCNRLQFITVGNNHQSFEPVKEK